MVAVKFNPPDGPGIDSCGLVFPFLVSLEGSEASPGSSGYTLPLLI